VNVRAGEGTAPIIRFAAKDTIKVDCKGGMMKFDKG
jgi:hypothetical protein